MLFLGVLSILLGVSLGYCPSNAIYTNDQKSCYTLLELSTAFNRADEYCQNEYGFGASITNGIDNQQLLVMARDFFRQKLPTARDFWLGAHYDGKNTQWSDGTTSNYTNLDSDERNIGNVVMRLADGRWRIASWDETNPLACIFKNEPPQNVIYPCDSEWYYAKSINKCLKVLKTVGGLTWDSADAGCKDLGALLASIHSDEQMRIMIDVANTDIKVSTYLQTWLGGARTGPNRDDWRWIDGTPYDYQNWAVGKPDNPGQQCLQLWTSPVNDIELENGAMPHWDDGACESLNFNAICQKAARF